MLSGKTKTFAHCGLVSRFVQPEHLQQYLTSDKLHLMSPSRSGREAEVSVSRYPPVGDRPLLPVSGGLEQQQQQQQARPQNSLHVTPGSSNTLLRRNSHTDTVAIVPANHWTAAEGGLPPHWSRGFCCYTKSHDLSSSCESCFG